MEQISIKQREILLVPFPFSDQSGKKVRPVAVISNNKFNEFSSDVITMGITSNIMKDIYTIPLSNEDLEEGHLFDECRIKAENILKIDQDLIIKKIGRINKKKFIETVSILGSIIKLDNL